MARPGLVVLVGLLLVGLLGGHAMAQPDRGPGFATQQEFERTVFEVTVFGNGSARWTFKFTRPLTNDSQRQQFREYADRFNTEDTELWLNFQDRASILTGAGADTTGRNMTARSFDREARVNPLGNRGVVEMSFVWTGFAPVEGEQVRVGDVFEDGLYIGPGQQFDIEAGPGLAFQADAVEPTPNNMTGASVAESDSLSWDGERQFSDQRPRVVLAPADTTGGTPTAEPTEMTTTTTGAGNETAIAPDDAGGGFPVMVVSLIVLLLGLGAGAAWKSGALTPGDDDGGAAAGASASDGGAAAAEAGATEAGTAETETTESAADADPEPAVPEEELLTDEDRVLQLLEENGGRMKQANIVEETGWSKSKVSMLLSDMEDEEEISKLRVGRENIVSLSGHEPDAAGSPFEDED